MELFPWLLWLHIFGAIAAFGPTFVFPLIGGMGGKEPMHSNFAIRIVEKIERGVALPLIVVQGVTGVGLLLLSGRNLSEPGNYWLGASIVLYALGLTFSILVQTKRIGHVVALTSSPPPPPAPGAAPSGPPPEVLAAVKAVDQGGLLLTVIAVTIIFLMVLKPAF